MNASKWLVVSVHDVSPATWDRVQRMLDALDAGGVSRRSLLVIPNFQGQWPIDHHDDFCAALRGLQEQGDEMVLHGYEHVGVGAPDGVWDRFKNRWFTQGEGEFLTLDYDAARRRIERGLELTRRTRLDVRGFVAPAWLINAEGLRAARDCGLEYTNSYLRLIDLARSTSRFAPSLVFGPGNLNEDFGIGVQRSLSGLLSRSPIVRVVLHPPCIDHPKRFERILGMIRTQLEDHRAVTYIELLSRLHAAATATEAPHAN
jgi:YD repeat-containing protein